MTEQTSLTPPGVDDEPVAEEQPEAAPPQRSPRLPWIVAGVASVVAVAAIVAAILFASWWAPLHNEARDREEAHTIGSEFALHLTSFEGETIDEWVAETQEWATGSYAEQLNRLFDEELRAALRDADVVSQGSLLNLFVQDADGGEATLFAVVRQTIDNRFTEEPFEDELRMEIVLQQVDDEWRVSDVAVLGPGQLTMPPPVDEGSAP
jgi:hypothetical protein